jgi:SLT domain-containing protein
MSCISLDKFYLFQQESGKDKQLQEVGEQQRSQLVTVTAKRREKEEEMQLAREEMERLKQCLDSLQLDVNKLTVKLSQV